MLNQMKSLTTIHVLFRRVSLLKDREHYARGCIWRLAALKWNNSTKYINLKELELLD